MMTKLLEWEDADMVGFNLDELLGQRLDSLPRAVARELRDWGYTLTERQAELIAAGLEERWQSRIPDGQETANMAALLRSAGIAVAPARNSDEPRPLVAEIDPEQMSLHDVLDGHVPAAPVGSGVR